MTRYAAGRRKEWDAVKRLKSHGWNAQRSAGSRGLWDVTAAKHGQRVRLIQCKYTAQGRELGTALLHPPAGVVDKNARALLALQGAEATPVDVELWVYYRGRAMPAVYTPWNGAWTFDASEWAR